MKRSMIFALAILSSGLTVSPAAAQDRVTSVVRTADLDLNTDAGREALNGRIAQAAREVCGAASNVDLEGKNAARHCRDQVIAEATLKRDQILAAKSGEVIQVAVR
jgi:UrcA family protein